MPFDINDFRSEVNAQGGLAKSSNFRALITGGVLKNSKAKAIGLLLNQASIPGRILATNEIQTYGPVRKAPYRTSYDDVQVSIYCTNDNLFPRDLFEEWQSAIINTQTGQANYFDQYVADIELEQYDDEGKTTFACKLIDAYPIIVSPLALDWSAAGTIQNLSVTFAYRRWQLDPLPISPFGNNLAINSLYPNFDLQGTIDNAGIALISRASGQFMSHTKKAGNFLGNAF